jgi:hypothetical protein
MTSALTAASKSSATLSTCTDAARTSRPLSNGLKSRRGRRQERSHSPCKQGDKEENAYANTLHLVFYEVTPGEYRRRTPEMCSGMRACGIGYADELWK